MYVSLSGVGSVLIVLAPLLIWPERLPASLPLDSIGGPKGPNAQFLRDFGKTLVEKYNPKAIVVFSAHWETHGHIEGTHPTSLIPISSPSRPWLLWTYVHLSWYCYEIVGHYWTGATISCGGVIDGSYEL